MPTVKLNKEVFEKLVGKKLPIEKLKDRISMLGTDLDGIEGNEINVEVFPNRPDMLSEQGFARAFASFIETKPGLREYKVESSGEKVIIDKSVNPVRPFTTCSIVKGLKFDDETIKEVIQLQEKLHITYGRNRKKFAIGIYPMEKIKFPITFFAEDPDKIKFQPLEYPSELTGRQILSKHPTGREYADQLEGMDKFPFFKDANDKILSMPPIINSHDVGKIDEKTKNVFIECSGFDLEYLKNGLNMLVTALEDMGGKIYSLELDFGDKKITTPDLSPKEWPIDIEYINKRLGVKLKENQLQHLLAKMGHDYKDGKVLSPAYRTDIMHPVDFVTDVAIAYGYENFEPEIPDVSTLGEENSFEKFKKNIARILTGLKLLETETYNLTSKENQNTKMLTTLPLIELKSAVNNEYNMLRAWMLPSLMGVLNFNLNQEYPQNIFGIGTVFKKGNTETGVEETDRLAITLCDESADFTKIKQVLDYLMRMLNMTYEVVETEHPSFIPGRVGRVIVNKKEVAYIGELHPEVLTNFQLENPVACLELNLTELFE